MTDEQSSLDLVLEHEELFERKAQQDDTEGATARYLLKKARGERVSEETLEASRFPLSGDAKEFRDVWTAGPATPSEPTEAAMRREVERLLDTAAEGG